MESPEHARVRELVERFWKDVANLPWQDQVWVSNEALKEQTRQHYVNATTSDMWELFKLKEEDNATTASNDQE